MHLQIVIGLLSICFVILEAFRSEVIRGYPCVRRNNQLYCPTPGNKFPSLNIKINTTSTLSTTPLPSTSSAVYIHNITTTPSSTKSTTTTYFMYYTKKSLEEHNDDDNSLHDNNNADVEENIIDDGDQVIKRVKREQIDSFIDENKALIRRMFGEYNTPDDEVHPDARDHYASYSSNGQAIHKRPKRARSNSYTSNKIDSCESAVEIVTPYWASNSAGKIRAIVNTQHLQQAIQQEVCQSVQTKRCNNDCSCEQKYKWHRLLAYDPDDDCKGIFMDWFLFPSCCVCRCTRL